MGRSAATRSLSGYNKALKLAIVEAETTQRRVSRSARLSSENRLSQIINGVGAPATDQEKRAIAKTLSKRVPDLFGTNGTAP